MTQNTDTPTDAQYGLTGRRRAAALAEEQARKYNVPESSEEKPKAPSPPTDTASGASSRLSGEGLEIIQNVTRVEDEDG